MKAEDFKEKVKEILEAEIKFDGHVNQIVGAVTDERQESILNWIKNCKKGMIRPEPCKKFKSLISFIYKSNDNRIRGILTKEKNSYFIELFLDKHMKTKNYLFSVLKLSIYLNFMHKYYDRKRRFLGL